MKLMKKLLAIRVVSVVLIVMIAITAVSPAAYAVISLPGWDPPTGSIDYTYYHGTKTATGLTLDYDVVGMSYPLNVYIHAEATMTASFFTYKATLTIDVLQCQIEVSSDDCVGTVLDEDTKREYWGGTTTAKVDSFIDFEGGCVIYSLVFIEASAYFGGSTRDFRVIYSPIPSLIYQRSWSGLPSGVQETLSLIMIINLLSP